MPKECFISGDILVLELNDRRIDIFRYDPYSNSYKRNQDPLIGEHSSVSFNNNHLVYSATSSNSEQGCFYHKPEGFKVYHQLDMNQAYHQPYILQQHVNFTDLGFGGCQSSSSISHDKDLLVVGDDNKTRIYVQDNDSSWKEELVLDNQFRQYRVSGRNLLATVYNETTNEDEVYYFNIEGCASTPTQVPSSSTAPSSTTYPTQVITQVPSIPVSVTLTSAYTGSFNGFGKTQAPTSVVSCSPISLASSTSTSQLSSFKPSETCYWVDILVIYDDEPLNSVWDIQRVNLLVRMMYQRYTGVLQMTYSK